MTYFLVSLPTTDNPDTMGALNDHFNKGTLIFHEENEDNKENFSQHNDIRRNYYVLTGTRDHTSITIDNVEDYSEDVPHNIIDITDIYETNSQIDSELSSQTNLKTSFGQLKYAINVDNIADEYFQQALISLNIKLANFGNVKLQKKLINLSNQLIEDFNDPKNNDKSEIFKRFETQFKSCFGIETSPSVFQSFCKTLAKVIIKGLCAALFITLGTLLGASIGTLLGPVGTTAGAILGFKIGLTASAVIAGSALTILHISERSNKIHQQTFFANNYQKPLKEVEKSMKSALKLS